MADVCHGSGLLVSDIALEFGQDAFEDNDVGIRFTPSFAALLRETVEKLQNCQPGGALLLEGHTPGLPAENNPMRCSIGEEAAALLRDHLEREGVCRPIRCIGYGSAEGLGLRVRVRLEGTETPDTQAPPTPANPTSSIQDTLRQIRHQIHQLSCAMPLTFKSNSSDLSQEGTCFVLKTAKLARSHPELTIQCSGFAKGLPEEDNQAKRELSKLRADAVAKTLQKHGVRNKILSYGFGSALGSGLCASVDFLAPDEDAEGNEFRSIPNVELVTEDQEGSVVDALLKELLLQFSFEPNGVRISASPLLRMVALVLKSFPSWIIRCEGHAKGLPKENNLEKKQLSLARSENVRKALQELGVRNPIHCFGYGSEMGIGKAVRMYALERQGALRIPELTDMTADDREKELNRLLEQMLSSNIDFVPNQTAIPKSAGGVLSSIADLLRAFPDEMVLVCEAHARGLPEEHSESKEKLTRRRAELWCQELRSRGVLQDLQCRGAGCAEGLGPCVRMWVTSQAPVESPAVSDQEDPRTRVNVLLAAALEKDGAVKFATNSYQVPAAAAGVIKALATVLATCRQCPICVEGHAKGQPGENSEAKQRLSRMRAEALKVELRKAGVSNPIRCIGRGSDGGLGTCFQVVVDEGQTSLEETEVTLQDTQLSVEERRRLLEERLDAILDGGFKFQPNTMELQLGSAIALSKVAQLLKAFPDVTVESVGHAKGRPEDNNDARVRLSEDRAAVVRRALVAEGVANAITCTGVGSSLGLGTKVCLRTVHPGDRKSVV